MPEFSSAIRTKIDALRTRQAAGENFDVYEMVQIDWPSPDGTIYYSVTQVDEVAFEPPPVSPVQARLIPDGNPDWFLPVLIDATIGDEEVDLDFWDGDGVISDLLVDHGEGIKVTLLYWIPDEELLLPIWYGHLRLEDESEPDRCKLKAVQGFRSSEGLLPRRAHWRECQAIFGGVFDTQEEIDENDCPYNKHIGGSVGNFETGSTPYASYPRHTRDDCTARLGNNDNFMLSHATQSTVVANNQTKGPRLYSVSQGNETSLKDPVPVIMGTRRLRGMPVIAFRRDRNTNDPEHGWFVAIYEACEGPNHSLSGAEITVGSETQQAVPLHYNYRLGDQGQTPVSTLTPHSYSSTALIVYAFGWVDPETVDPGSASASVFILGLNNIRVYSDVDTYAVGYTNNRVWQIAKMLTDKRWGFGYDYDRLNIESFIAAAEWSAQNVQFVDYNGDEWPHTRGTSHVELRGRKIQQQIEDMCLAGRLSRPFWFDGKIHIVPLKNEGDSYVGIELSAEGISTSEIELTWTEPSESSGEGDPDVPFFTDGGDTPNILFEEVDGVWRSSIKRSRISDLDLTNRVECTFDDSEDEYLERPLRPIEDVDAQLRAGRVVGDFSRKTNIKKYALAGVVFEGQAIKVATGILDLGPFDEGGLQNNLELTFKAWYLDCLDLYQSRRIRVQSSLITRYGFQYFRVKSMKRLANLQVELTVQAYNETYMGQFEQVFGTIPDPPDDPEDPTPTPPAPPTDPLVFGDITYGSGVLNIDFTASP